ncbi:MAG: hypothetical protein QW734_07120 [Candidatus Bathyarchaeia archaeon]
MGSTDVEFGIEQIKKNLLLLQDHASSYPCPSCIRKHLLSLEAYAEETIPMVKDQRLKEKLKEIREWAFRKRSELEGEV